MRLKQARVRYTNSLGWKLVHVMLVHDWFKADLTTVIGKKDYRFIGAAENAMLEELEPRFDWAITRAIERVVQQYLESER